MDDWTLAIRLGVVAAVLGGSILIAFGLHEFERLRQRRPLDTQAEADAWDHWFWDDPAEA